MLRAKYKIHRLVNIIFYGSFWFSGFLVGYGFKGGNIFEKIKDIFNSWFV